MNKKLAYQLGYDTGYDIASSNIHTELDSEHFTKDDLDNFASLCIETESDSFRQYSPFEFTAKEFNDSHDPDGMWESYEDGVYRGIQKRIREYKKDNREGYLM